MTTPYRKAKRNWKLILVALVILVSLAAGNYALHERGADLNRVIYDQCVANELQDAVIVAQLEAAKRRAEASLPPNSAELIYQLEILDDGINALEPPDETECNPPEEHLP